ncbi:MAG: alanine racemase C-terminal domain-containing protein [Hyphomicrobiales bacterium]
MGEHVTVNDVARWAGTIPYEILTGLGSRFSRHYVPCDPPGPMSKRDQP